ncbi:putative inorganic carbon transporter subunit DabA [Phycicoccus duodecadis]|uniref:putative inorganic carbon transporter subunit DabA n=1 Tax=Phycicoccus duodecadis TaxID=173053 RepID=UPI000C70CB10|nr:putative inorganic carbon transporter subunit DabA [Phycicoccus duodecadis]
MIPLLGVRTLSLSVLLVGLSGLVPEAVGDPLQGALPLAPGLSWRWRLDVAACVLLVFFGVLGWVVARFCAANLRGRRRAGRVGALLTGLLLALTLLAVSSSIVTFALGWTASGLLMTALIARTGTQHAGAAARRMRRTLLAGDLALWLAVAAWVAWLPSTDRAAAVTGASDGRVVVVAALLALACVARSGLFPAHRWLPETAEAPSPISALLHAGIVNGAGVLAVVAWPVFAAAPVVLAGLFGVGVLTLLLGGWSGAARRDVKGRLASSTTTQMAYMTIQVGLGLPAMALMHLVAHGCYKSWLFLRAGGAVDRHGHRWATVRRPRAQLAAAGAALLVVVLLAWPAARALLETQGPVALLPLAVAAAAVALGGWNAASLARIRTRTVLGVVLLAGAGGTTYVWAMARWEGFLSPVLPPAPVWEGWAAAPLLAVAALAGVALVAGSRRVVSDPAGALALRLFPLTLTPGSRARGAVPASVVAACAADATREPSAEERATLVATVEDVARAGGPAWPLRAMVAANPLAGLEHLPYLDAIAAAEAFHGHDLQPGLSFYLHGHETGRITDADLAAAQRPRDAAPRPAPEVVAGTRLLAEAARHPVSASGGRLVQQHAVPHADAVAEHENAWTQLAWSTVSPRPDHRAAATQAEPEGPYHLWRRAAQHRSYDGVIGIAGAAAWARTLPADPVAAILLLVRRAGTSTSDMRSLITSTLAAAPGWSAHAAWRAREQGGPGPLLELVAVRLAHDVLVGLCASSAAAAVASGPIPVPPAVDRHRNRHLGAAASGEAELRAIWQDALEVGPQRRLVASLGSSRARAAAGATGGRPATQSLWCIDVRSERVRRHLEQVGNHETYGFAGFFGAAVRFVDVEGHAHDLCPALVRPRHTVTERARPLRFREAVHRTATAVSRHPVAALAVAEGGGVLSATTAVATTVVPGRVRRMVRSATARGVRPADTGSLVVPWSVDEKTDVVESSLRAIGLVDGFAPVVLVCGHGATLENNAFATAYDCGACGGHPGPVNAAALAHLINDPEVRGRLAGRGIRIPDDTRALAALHDTTTDRVELLDPWDDPALERDLRTAGRRAAAQRLQALPPRGRSDTVAGLGDRAADWSEPTPEWGLAGNAAIVIGPRSLTRGTDLQGRVFLHSYDAGLDPRGEILEQLLTAPLVVAQWINAQYNFSALAPSTLGAGDKTTHNVVGDVGVVTGARGDLRVGLPWQALFTEDPGAAGLDGLVHEPLRLSALVAADPEAIRAVVDRHEVLRHLVVNRWVTVMAVDDDTVSVLRPDLTWAPWTTGDADDPTSASARVSTATRSVRPEHEPAPVPQEQP